MDLVAIGAGLPALRESALPKDEDDCSTADVKGGGYFSNSASQSVARRKRRLFFIS